MEELTLTTPSILFSAISLIMLAYTNRFLAYAQLVRNLKAEFEANPTPMAHKQLENLRRRLYMSRSMQIFGVASLFLCVLCTLLIYVGLQVAAAYTFGIALLLLIVSLGISLKELMISVRALEYHLDTLGKPLPPTRRPGNRSAGTTAAAEARTGNAASGSRSSSRRRPAKSAASQGENAEKGAARSAVRNNPRNAGKKTEKSSPERQGGEEN